MTFKILEKEKSPEELLGIYTQSEQAHIPQATVPALLITHAELRTWTEALA